MARQGFADQDFLPIGWFTHDVQAIGWWDRDLLTSGAPAAPFDAALMAAMNRPWPDIVHEKPQVVASGMTPPDTIIP